MTEIRVEPGGVRASAYNADVWAEIQGEMVQRMSPETLLGTWAWEIEEARK